MTTFNYPRIAATAVRLLGKFGAAGTMRRHTGGRYDPTTASAAGAVDEQWPCTVAVLDYAARDVDGTLIQASDRRLLVAPDIAQAPKPGDVFELADGAHLTAIRVSTVAPAGVAVLFDVQVRGR